MHPNFAGALINSALYLGMVFYAAILTQHGLSWKLAIAAAGVTYLSHVLQFSAYQAKSGAMRTLAEGIVILSIVLGGAAGLALLY